MIYIPGKIPIAIHPMFWLLAALLGWINSYSLMDTLIWIVLVTLSILAHEYGHALSGVAFGQQSHIELTGFGGVTTRKGAHLPLWKDFIVVACGPLASIALAAVSVFIQSLFPDIEGIWLKILKIVQWINLFWAFFNLLPVLPLDGGHLLRIALESFFGFKGFKMALGIGMAFSAVVALIGFFVGWLVVGIIFTLFAVEGYRNWKQAQTMAETDRSDSVQQTYVQALREYQLGHLDNAYEGFMKVREQAGKGMLYYMSTVHAAKIKNAQGHIHEAYQFLIPFKDKLNPEDLVLYHRLAVHNKDYEAAAAVAGDCYRIDPTSKTAYYNALIYGYLSDAKSTVGWLITAKKEGLALTPEILRHPAFDGVRDTEAFMELEKQL